MNRVSRKLLVGLSTLAIVALQPVLPVRAQAPAPSATANEADAEQSAATLLSDDEL